jgi:peptidoglycan L-alanyl-D-glutamate endopeptidase CwlK
MINSRDIEELKPEFKTKVLEWLALCRAAQINLKIISTYRDNEYQNFIYASGRTRAGQILTRARGGQSLHNQRLALDFCIMRGAKIDWANVGEYERAGKLAESIGIKWGGRFRNARGRPVGDFGHIEFKF